MAELRGVNLLQTELERAKESLKGVDENIRKLTGRDPTIQRPQRRVSVGSLDTRGGKSAGAEGRIFNLARRGIVQNEQSPRRRSGGAFSRLGPRPGERAQRRRGRDSGDEEDPLQKPIVQSSVIATPKEERSRQNSIEEQSKDRKGQARNRRMFGLLLGTLQKFKDESKESKDKEEQRIKIEKKLEEKFKQEKEEIIKERRQLFLQRKQKQFRIRLIEQKMEMAQNHENWATETRKLENFIRTKAKPHIFYMPKMLTPGLEEKLKDSKAAVDAMIEERRKKLEEEIEDMMSQVHDAEEDDGDASMGEEERSGEEEEDSEDEHERGQRDDKENREKRKSGDKEEFLSERELRDREREQRDRDRQMKDKLREERKRMREEGKGDGKGEKKSNKEGRDRSREHRDKSKDRDRDHAKHKDRSHSRSREHSRERHRSGRDKNEKRGRHHSEPEKSHGHGSKNKRRSKGEGKSEKREKVWEPMEDEEEEEFVGTKDSEKESAGNIQSKMLEMAGMADVAKEMRMETEGSTVRRNERSGSVEGEQTGDKGGVDILVAPEHYGADKDCAVDSERVTGKKNETENSSAESMAT